MKNRYLVFLFSFVMAAVFLTSCVDGGSFSGVAEYRKITAEEAQEIMDDDKDAIILDVRTQTEYDDGHIKGAVLIPNDTITDTRPEQLPDLDAVILVYCRSGNRSRQASEKLVAMGYTNVYDFGGITQWPYETVTDTE